MENGDVNRHPSHNQGNTLVIIGGGASGFFCAVNAARMNPSLKVIIDEKTNKLLSKVRVSGGGRCNVTHACFEILDVDGITGGFNFQHAWTSGWIAAKSISEIINTA